MGSGLWYHIDKERETEKLEKPKGQEPKALLRITDE